VPNCRVWLQSTIVSENPGQWACSFRIIPGSSQSSSEDISCLHEKHFHPLSAGGGNGQRMPVHHNRIQSWSCPVSDSMCSQKPGTTLSNMPYVLAPRGIITSLKEVRQGSEPQRQYVFFATTFCVFVAWLSLVCVNQYEEVGSYEGHTSWYVCFCESEKKGTERRRCMKREE
jgi:hypothetical protein